MLKRGDFVIVKEGSNTSLVLPNHNTDNVKKWRECDIKAYDSVGLVCSLNDKLTPNKVCLSFGAEIHWYSVEDVEHLPYPTDKDKSPFYRKRTN